MSGKSEKRLKHIRTPAVPVDRPEKDQEPQLPSHPAAAPPVAPAVRQHLVRRALLLLVITGAFLAVFYPASKARFELTDDHEILRFVSSKPVHPDLTDHFGPGETVWHIAFTRDIKQGRFRPAYYLIRLAEIALVKTNSTVWHGIQLGLGILTCFFFYLAGRRLGLSTPAAALMIAWLALQGGATEIWVRLGPSETEALLFLSIALLSIALAAGSRDARRWDTAALVSMALMGWSKETFILVTPALLLTRFALELRSHSRGWRESLRALRVPLSIGAILFAGQLSMALWLYLRGGYGTHVVNLVVHPYSPAAWAALLSKLADRFSYYIPVGFAVLLLISDAVKRKPVSRYAAAVLIILAALILPQLALLIPQRTNCRYAYPLIVGLAAANAFALDGIWKRDRRLAAPCVAAGIILLIPAALGTRVYATNFTNQTIAFNRMLDHVAKIANPDKKIVLFIHPLRHYEASISMVMHLGSRGVTSPIFVHPAGNYRRRETTTVEMLQFEFPRRVDTADLSPDFLERLRSDVNPQPGKALRSDEVNIVIPLPPDKYWAADQPSWFDPALYRETEFKQPRWSEHRFGWKRSGNYHYRVFERIRASTKESGRTD